MSNKKRKINNLGNIVSVLLCTGIGAIFGYTGGDIIGDSMAMGNNLGTKLIILGAVIFSFVIALYIQIIVHEGGHYIFGKLTGYSFSSFRIGSMMFIKEDGRIKRKKFTIMGTGGQCLMSPPQWEDEKYPYVLYNLGGSIANIVFGLVVYALYKVLPMIPVFSTFLYAIFVLGILFAVINAVPMKAGGIANDGYNMVSIKKNNDSRRAFWLQLHINSLIAKGVRIKEMPEEWFKMPAEESLEIAAVSGMAIFSCSYYHDKHEFNKALEISEYLLNNVPTLLEVYKNELRCEMLFYEIIGECRQEIIDSIYTTNLKKYIKATSSYISRKRLLYAYEMLVTKNAKEAEKKLADFETVAKTYPYRSEVESEREILEIINNKKYEINKA